QGQPQLAHRVHGKAGLALDDRAAGDAAGGRHAAGDRGPEAPGGQTPRVPPSRLLASPIAETVASILEPDAAKAGRRAVTITAATFLVLSRPVAAGSWVLTPSRSIIDWIACLVNGAFCSESPVLF